MSRCAWLVLGLAGCVMPGEPRGLSVAGQPAKVEDFDTLYGSNCAGCHGEEGRGGATLGLANPVYLAIADDATLRAATADGVPGTAMPAFAERAGGMLTAKQVDLLVAGMRARWARPSLLAGATPPPYAAPAGDAGRGHAVYASACAACHGGDGGGGPGGHSVVDGSFLALVSAQYLRTLIIAGRPDIGQPDWRGDVAGHPLTSQQIADVVAWLQQHRPEYAGQPYTPAR